MLNAVLFSCNRGTGRKEMRGEEQVPAAEAGGGGGGRGGGGQDESILGHC